MMVLEIIIFNKLAKQFPLQISPTNQSACIGETAEFEVIGIIQVGIIYYQWQFLDATTGIWNDLDGTNPKITGWILIN